LKGREFEREEHNAMMKACSFARFSLLTLIFGASIAYMSACTGNDSSSTVTEIPQISLLKIAGGFTGPVHVTHAGDGSGRLFVVEKQGVIRIIRNGVVLDTPFLDISGIVKSVGGEQGLFSAAFSPDFAVNGRFYVDYTGFGGTIGDTVVARYRSSADQDSADPASAEQLLTVSQPFENHNGGQLAFGPDGYLYIGKGDGGSGGDPLGNAQAPGTLLGKMLRIDVESGAIPYAIPEDNPFVNEPGFLPEIWALGLRNPWRFSFDRELGDLYIADVGQDSFEEVNVQSRVSPGGENYGWNIMEGLHCFLAADCDQAGLALPAAVYSHGAGECSITGGFVYRGQEFSGLQGVYLYGDLCSGKIWGLRSVGDAWENKLVLDSELTISTFGEDEEGNLFVADFTAGDIYKIIVPVAAP
jgi:glucose/arabinose dehydrogenase